MNHQPYWQVRNRRENLKITAQLMIGCALVLGLGVLCMLLLMARPAHAQDSGQPVPPPQPTPARITNEQIDAMRAQARAYGDQAASAAQAAQAANAAAAAELARAQAVQAQFQAALQAAQAAQAAADRMDVAVARQSAGDALALVGQAQHDLNLIILNYRQVSDDTAFVVTTARDLQTKYDQLIASLGAYRLVTAARLNGLEKSIADRDQQIATLMVVKAQTADLNTANGQLQMALILASVLMTMMGIFMVVVVRKWRPVLVDRQPVTNNLIVVQPELKGGETKGRHTDLPQQAS